MFTEKQKVWCAIYGAGVVEEILHASEGVYPVVVRFKDTRLAAYTSDGKYYKGGNVTLFPYPIEITMAITKPSIDWNHVSPEYNYLAQDENGDGVFQNNRCLRVFKDKNRFNGQAYDIEGRIFREPDGGCYTSSDSCVPVTFPYTPKREYVDVDG